MGCPGDACDVATWLMRSTWVEANLYSYLVSDTEAGRLGGRIRDQGLSRVRLVDHVAVVPEIAVAETLNGPRMWQGY